MKRRLLSICVLPLLLWGCGPSGDFKKLKTYLDNNPGHITNKEQLFRKLKATYEPLETSIPFLLDMTKSTDPEEAVTAYVALATLCSQVAGTPTPQGKAQVDRIKPKELYQYFETFDSSGLDSDWTERFEFTHSVMKQSLEQELSPSPADPEN